MPNARLSAATAPTVWGAEQCALFGRVEALRRRPGRALPDPLRSRLEGHVGVDLAAVRIFDRREARAVVADFGAAGVAVGGDIFLADRLEVTNFTLLAHEVVHCIQQGFAAQAPCAVDPDPRCEAEAERIAAHGGRPKLTAPVSVQRHPGEPCPAPPQYVEITNLSPTELWLDANLSIELAYKATHPKNTVLVGSDFIQWRTITLPRGVPGRAEADAILKQFSGLTKQRAPDIIDFTLQTIYEIKTVRGTASGVRQLDDMYRTIEAIRQSTGGPNWNRSLATWFPPHRLPMVRPNHILCTAATDHRAPREGLISYSVHRRTTPEEEQELAQASIFLTDLQPELSTLRPRVLAELGRVASGIAGGSDVWMIAPPQFWDMFVFAQQQARMERTLEMMRVHAMDARMNPVIGFRNLGWTMVFIYAASLATVYMAGSVVLAGEAVAGVGAVGAVGGAAGGMGSGGGTVVSLAAYRAARTATAVRDLAVAAGVLFTVTSVSVDADASVPVVRPLNSTAVRAVRADLFPDDNYGLGGTVTFEGASYRIIGRAQTP